MSQKALRLFISACIILMVLVVGGCNNETGDLVEYPDVDREDPLMPEHMIEHEMREHREQAGVLEMLRDHLVPGEVYELGEMDLRFADLVPDFHLEYTAPRRRASEAAGPGRSPLLEA